MGVPKFYRWISERYPCLSEVVKEYQVPEFDNLYLDMNGIIHNCSHPNDDDPHFRISEEQIFKDIFRYIEVLFRIISPKKTFFMAVDGVAPRAKMNQQRGRRFRSAKEAEQNIQQALRKGESLPTEKRFDSNCITPGTKFMVKLQAQLEYFVQSKITSDHAWQNVNVYLSGHQTPGEGEHKIMEFIRHERSQANYDVNTRHCLYGLDADLIMLALCTHEPNFSLLREEVQFSRRQRAKSTSRAEETTFHLLHISLLREYIDHEFGLLKTSLPFEYDLEAVIDDWVLMGFLVGNDFIPHLPNLHISANALPFLYKSYIRVLPQLDGYLNEKGEINLRRFQLYLHEISRFDRDHFEEVYADYKWLESRAATKHNAASSHSAQKSLQIIKDLALRQGTISPTSTTSDQEEDDDADDDTFEKEFKLHKRAYYEDKFHVTATRQQVSVIAFEYILGLQWICHYYYNGVQSWGWFYPYHYSPYMTDLKNIDEMKLKFKMGKPFLPFHQLLAVLPAASKECVPEPLWCLMEEETSPIGDFYPANFTTDLNGKQQEWEAVVLIPFIDENRLLDAMESCIVGVTTEESSRNRHAPCCMYTHDPTTKRLVKSSLPHALPDIVKCTARCESVSMQQWVKKDYRKYVKGILPDCQLAVYHQGFSTLYHLPHRSYLKKQGVKVFHTQSRSENMILKIVSDCDDLDQDRTKYRAYVSCGEELEKMAERLLEKCVYVNWPHLEEAKVVAVCDGSVKYCYQEVAGSGGLKHKLNRKELTPHEKEQFIGTVHDLDEKSLNSRGIDVGETDVVLDVRLMLGCKHVCGERGDITLEKQWSNSTLPFAAQTVVQDILVKGEVFDQVASASDLFPAHSSVFHLGIPHYGCCGKVIRASQAQAVVRLRIPAEPDLASVRRTVNATSYLPGWKFASTVGNISSYLLSRITGSIYVFFPHQQKWNIGLNLRFNKENCGIAGYTMRKQNEWLYSMGLRAVMEEYMSRFPEVFVYLNQAFAKNNNEQLDAEQMFDSENVTEKLVELSKWLKQLPCHNGCKVRETSSVVEPGVVKEVEVVLAHFKEAGKDESEVEVSVQLNSLHTPRTHRGSLLPDASAQHSLLDRVVNVREGYTVPVGLRGTIIGKHLQEGEEMFDVCFDEEFMGGLSLGGRCSSRRGYKVPACSIINLTHGERQLNVGKHRPVAVVKPVHQQMISSTSHNLSSHKSVRRGMEPSAPHGRNNFSPPRSPSRESNTHHQTSTHGSHHQRPLSALRRNSQKPPRFQALSKAKPAQDPVSSKTNGDVEASSSSHPKFRVDHKSNATSVYVDGKMKKLSDELKHVLKLGTSRNHPQPCRGFFMTQQPRVHASSKHADGRRANFTLQSRQVATSRGSSSSRHPQASTRFARKEGTDKLWESLAAEANARNCLNETAKSKTAEASPEVDGSKFDDAPAEDANTVEESKEEKQQLVEEQKGSEDDETCAVDDVRSTSVEDCVAPASSSQHDGDTEGGLHVDELMKWCRARGMFPPIYTYSDALQEVGKYTSTVQLWNGLSFSSTPQPTRRQATETAAAFAIAHLARNVVSSNPISTPHPSGLTHCRQPPPAVPPFIFPDGMKIQGREYFHTPPMPMHHSSVGFQFPHAVFPHSPLTTTMRGTEFGVLPPAQLLAYVPPYMGSHHGPYHPPAFHNHHQPPHHVVSQHLPLYGYHQPFAFPASPGSPLQPADGFVTGGRPPHPFACTFIPSQVLRQQALAHHVRANFLLSDHPAVTSSPECDVVTSSSRDHSAAPAAGDQPVTSCAQPVTSSSASTTSKNEGACAKWTSGGKTRPKLAISFANN